MKRPSGLLSFLLMGAGLALLLTGLIGKWAQPWIDAHALVALIFGGIYLLRFGYWTGVQGLSGRELITRSGTFNLYIGMAFILGVMTTQSLSPGWLQALRANLFWPGLLFLLNGFRISVIKNDSMPAWRKNLSTLGLALVFLFVCLESIFMFQPMTIGSAANLSSRLWFAKYWQPENSLGYRDIALSNPGKPKVIFLGDSFTAGQGIEQIEDRFADQYRIKTGRDVVVAAHCGADTQMELDYLRDFPEKYAVDQVVLNWYVNDLRGNAEKMGFKYEPEVGFWEGKAPQFVVESSYFLSYLYGIWPRSGDFGYAEYLENIWSNPQVLAANQAEILAIQTEAERRGAKLSVNLFPLLPDPELSRPLLQKMQAFCTEHALPARDFTDLSLLLPMEERLVSPYDAHPGEAWHRAVAEELRYATLSGS